MDDSLMDFMLKSIIMAVFLCLVVGALMLWIKQFKRDMRKGRFMLRYDSGAVVHLGEEIWLEAKKDARTAKKKGAVVKIVEITDKGGIVVCFNRFSEFKANIAAILKEGI